MKVHGDFKYLQNIYHSTEERKSKRFGMTWGWVSDHKMFIFG